MNTVTCEEHEELAAQAYALLKPLQNWYHDCHGASAKVVGDGAFAPCRLARGVCQGVGSQHSWVVLGDDCYDETATIIDPTLWSYDPAVVGILVCSMEDGRHRPHGSGSIWDWGKPVSGGGAPITLEPKEPFSDAALLFLELLGPLDRDGWIMLANGPVEQWPAAEIMPAIEDTVGPVVPIDIIGMLTDRNPTGVYLAAPEQERG
jgi:hypothetical protein